MTLNIKLIPYRRTPTKNYEFCTISGWGVENESKEKYNIYFYAANIGKIIFIFFLDSSIHSIYLKRTDVQTTPYDNCKRMYSSLLTNNMICASAPGRDACQVSKILSLIIYFNFVSTLLRIH